MEVEAQGVVRARYLAYVRDCSNLTIVGAGMPFSDAKGC